MVYYCVVASVHYCDTSLQPQVGPAAKRSRKSDPVKFLPTLPAVSVVDYRNSYVYLYVLEHTTNVYKQR